MTTSAVKLRIGFGEFVVLAAALMSIQAIAIDGMLPALPAIGRELLSTDGNRTQWVVTVYVVGMGIGQLFWGLIADRFGRRSVLLSGLTLYTLAAVGCALSRNFEVLLIWRMIHGVAAACAVVTRSIIRDVYSGRAMARVMSLTYIVFMVVPIVAPGVGAAFLMLWPWRYIFVLFGSFAAVTLFWALARLPETLNPDDRLILSTSHIAAAARMALATPVSFGYTLAVTMTFGSILAYIAMAPQIFGVTFERASWMPAMFALCALSMSLASYLNSRIVERLGMRVISHAALLTFIAVTAVHLLVASLGYERMWTFVLLQSLTMGSVGLTASNFGAMAMEPVGAAAGVGASLQGFVTTFGAAIIAAVIGKAFDGSTVPLAAGSLCCGLAALGFVLVGERGRLFVQRAAAAQPQATVVYERHLE